jgi:hypothetical protein
LNFDAARKFVDQGKGGKVSSKEAEAFATSSEYSGILTNEYLDSNWPVGRLVTGVTPELYDSAVRALIDSDNLSYGSVDRAIKQAVERAPFWPYDLMPGEISSRDRDLRAGFLARVVMHADRCGLLVSLFEDAGKINASQHLHQLALLIRRYDEVRGLGYDRPAA